MSETQKNGGIIFKNDKKTEPKHPDYTGKINVDGNDKQIALWIKEGKNGKFFSVKISDVRGSTGNNENGDLPF